MFRQNSKRVAIFQAEWPLQSQTVNCAIMLAEAGYMVDLFLYETLVYYELNQLSKSPKVQVHIFSRSDKDEGNASPTLKTRVSVLKKASEFIAFIRGREDNLLPDWILLKAQELMEGNNYSYLIGIEKKGLIWAGLIGEQLGIPYVYYSLELYTRDHPVSKQSRHAIEIKLAEEGYHRKSFATIVQDPERAQVLLKDNGIKSCRLFYVPVSLLGGPYRNRSLLLQERFGFHRDQIVILQLGQICEERSSIELAKVAQGFPKNWVLVLHGYGPDSDIRKIQEIDVHGRVFLSLDMVPSDQIQDLVASAHIGLVFYSPFTMNDFLTAFSSEKIALYLQCGAPIIAFDYPGYKRLIDQHRCGVVIKTLQEFPGAIKQILSSYGDFKSQSYECFMNFYDFSKNFQKVIDGIDSEISYFKH